MADVPISVTIFTTIVGAASGWLTAMWKNRDRRKHRALRILQQARNELDSNSHLQKVLEILEAERANRSIPNDLHPWEMRGLPVFLESVATHWEFKIVDLDMAYDVVGHEVIICDESTLLWNGEDPPRAAIYWRLFNLFASAMQRERKRRGGHERRSAKA